MAIVLTKEQSKPVNSDCKINTCYAVPGSGKSTVLLARAERLWKETNQPILIVTFSTSACENLLKRLSPDVSSHITIKTIHSFCYDIVKTFWKELKIIYGTEYWAEEPKLITKEEELVILGKNFKENSNHLYELFSYLRGLSIPPEQILRLFKKKVYFEKVKQLDIENFITYERIRLSKGLINFDDMADLTECLIPLPNVAIYLSRKYEHLLIDESQDTSEQQWKILRPLIINATSSLAVGDVNQSVYGFRGADGTVLSNMAMMENAVTFRLSQSFRSGFNIANIANKICFDKTSQIVSQDHLGDVQAWKFDSIDDEVNWVFKNITNDSAIISRTNKYLEKFERACITNEVPYLGKSFYRSDHIKDFYEFIFSFSGSDLETVVNKAYINNFSYSKLHIEDFKLAYNIIKKEGKEVFMNLIEEAQSLEAPGVTLTTGHASKGLEWKKVFVVGCHTGHVPHKFSNDLKEERNLLYVMTSRAQDELVITCINSPSNFLPKDIRDGIRSTSP